VNEVFRLILDPPRPAATNMAVDEYLMEQARKTGKTTLRLYSWERPAYSVGYFQDVKAISRKMKGASVVRRLTGGGLVPHGKDLTFSLAMRYPNRFFSATDVKDSYLKVNMALLRGLKNISPALDFMDCRGAASARGTGERACFESPTCYDLMLAKKKVVGSSQRRSAGVLLHQSAMFFDEAKEKLIPQVIEGFKAEWKIAFKEEPLNGEEQKEIAKLENARYRDQDWAFLEASFLA
jgi:lipoyl(octanoyl) transferase